MVTIRDVAGVSPGTVSRVVIGLVGYSNETEPVKLPAGTVLLTATPLEQDGWLQPDNAAWVLQNGHFCRPAPAGFVKHGFPEPVPSQGRMDARPLLPSRLSVVARPTGTHSADCRDPRTFH